MLWSGMRRWWGIAFVVTWLVVTVVLNSTGTSDTASVRIAGIAATVIGALTWFLTRTLRRTRSESRSEE